MNMLNKLNGDVFLCWCSATKSLRSTVQWWNVGVTTRRCTFYSLFAACQNLPQPKWELKIIPVPVIYRGWYLSKRQNVRWAHDGKGGQTKSWEPMENSIHRANFKEMWVVINIARDFLLCHSRVLYHAFYYF